MIPSGPAVNLLLVNDISSQAAIWIRLRDIRLSGYQGAYGSEWHDHGYKGQQEFISAIKVLQCAEVNHLLLLCGGATPYLLMRVW